MLEKDPLQTGYVPESSSIGSRIGAKNPKRMAKLPSKVQRYWNFLRHIIVKNEGSLLVNHWDFLKGTIGDLRDSSEFKLQDLKDKPDADVKSKTLKSPASRRWKKVRDLLIVDYDPPAKEKWSFLREWLIVDDELGDGWNELRDFARNRVEVPQGADWEIFRTLFFEDRGVRSHPHWAFLKDLLVKDAILASTLPGYSSHANRFYESIFTVAMKIASLMILHIFMACASIFKGISKSFPASE